MNKKNYCTTPGIGDALAAALAEATGIAKCISFMLRFNVIGRAPLYPEVLVVFKDNTAYSCDFHIFGKLMIHVFHTVYLYLQEDSTTQKSGYSTCCCFLMKEENNRRNRN